MAACDRPIARLLRGVTLLSTAALVVTGCSASPRPHTLVFDISGQGELSSLTYLINGKATTERSVRLPWRKTVQLPAKDGKDTWRLSTRLASGSSQTVVSVDGHPVISGACGGDGCNTNDSGSIGD